MPSACLIIGGASLHDIVWESAEKENGGGISPDLDLEMATRRSLGEQMKTFVP